jgi:hypothetical protein
MLAGMNAIAPAESFFEVSKLILKTSNDRLIDINLLSVMFINTLNDGKQTNYELIKV